MDNRPIGIFDSGLGGLTTIPYLKKLLPKERFIYFGDTGRTPYGSRDVDTIRRFSLEAMDFLASQDVKCILIACNTVSSTCISDLQARCSGIPVLGIIEPIAQAVAQAASPRESVCIIGTKALVASGAYQRVLSVLRPDLNLVSCACPAFVPLIESGVMEGPALEDAIHGTLDDVLAAHSVSRLVLCCTHYPIIQETLRKSYPSVTVMDPSEAVGTSVQALLTRRNLLAETPTRESVFYASDLSQNFMAMVARIFAEDDFEISLKTIGNCPEACK